MIKKQHRTQLFEKSNPMFTLCKNLSKLSHVILAAYLVCYLILEKNKNQVAVEVQEQKEDEKGF